MDDVKIALDKAASSPDPAVRGMALQYTEIRDKLASLEAFFAFYAEGVGVNGKISHTVKLPEKAVAVPRAPAKPRPVSNGHATAPSSSAKAEAFTKDILDILRQSEQPIPLPALQDIYESLKHEPPMQSETFRQRMITRQKAHIVVLIPRVGFWLPEASTESPVEPQTDV